MLIEQTRSRLQETPEFKLNQQIEILSFSPSINPREEGKWLIIVTSFAATNTVFNITEKKTTFFQSIHQVIGDQLVQKRLLQP